MGKGRYKRNSSSIGRAPSQAWHPLCRPVVVAEEEVAADSKARLPLEKKTTLTASAIPM